MIANYKVRKVSQRYTFVSWWNYRKSV